MIARINAKPEKALREALTAVAHIEAKQTPPSLAALDNMERAEALGLAVIITCYIVVDVCGNQWPNKASLRQVAEDLATGTTTAERLHLDSGEIYAYLSRTVLGSERMEDVITDEWQFTWLPIVLAAEALSVYCPRDRSPWDYLDQIESAIESASSLDPSVIPAAVMRAYLLKPAAGQA